MKKILFVLIISISVNSKAQFTKSTIANTNVNGAYGVLEKDLNNDNDIDLIVAAQASNTVLYYINDGNSAFTEHIVDNALTGAIYADAYDLDGDNDLDFVAVGAAEMNWYENDGNFSFTKHLIGNINNATFVRAYDADNDGDGDIGVAIYGENYITAYLNNGSGSFTRLNAVSISTPKIFHGGDFEGDGSGDILAPSFTDHKIEWHKFVNSILPHFELGGIVTSNFNGVIGVEGVDVDGDNDYDVIAAAYTDNEIAWFENTDGTGATGSFVKHSIDTNFTGASYVHWIDVDGDGDGDIVATAYGNGASGAEIAIYYNDGAQNFTKTTIDNLENGYQMFAVQDFDNNGTYDIAFAANLSNKLVLLSQTATNTASNSKTLFHLYPNPTDSQLYLITEKTIEQVCIFDISGRKLLKTAQKNINVNILPSGNYFVQIQFADATIATQKLIINH